MAVSFHPGLWWQVIRLGRLLLVEERHKEFWNYGKDLYVDLAARYPQGCRRLDY